MKYLMDPDENGITPLHAIIFILFIILMLAIAGGIETGGIL